MSKLFFITSSQTKLMNARYLARHFDVDIVPQPNYGIAYNEPRHVDRKSLLRESFLDALKRWSKNVNSKNHFFFIEDTSVIIPALSDEDNEVPGLEVKFWMQEMDFPTLDLTLKQLGKGRRAIVRSDVVLYLPPDLQKGEVDGSQYRVFTHTTEGSITEESISVTTNPLYPWLDDTSFNKWFVPDGESTVLSRLPISKADKHDIRKGSIGGMLGFLESKYILGKRRLTSTWAKESLLPMGWPRLLILCGLPCSGKTTVGTFLSEQCGYLHFEASDFMRMAYQMSSKEDSTLSLDAFAAKALRANPGIVAEEIAKNLERSAECLPAITGFRDPKEIERFKSNYAGPLEIRVIYLSASATVRYKRSVDRDRDDAAATIEAFEHKDQLQLTMGLDAIQSSADLIIKNESSKDDLYKEVLSALCAQNGQTLPQDAERSMGGIIKLEDRILLAMAQEKNTFRTTTEIAGLINSIFTSSAVVTNKNNVSRYFNQLVYPYYRIKKAGTKKRYAISSTGISRSIMLRRKYALRGTI